MAISFRKFLVEVANWMIAPVFLSLPILFWGGTQLSHKTAYLTAISLVLIIAEIAFGSGKNVKYLLSWFIFVLLFASQNYYNLGDRHLLQTVILLGTSLIWCITLAHFIRIGIRKIINLTQDWKEGRSSEQKRAERSKLVSELSLLIGNVSLATSFIEVVERLTEYVPEEGGRLLDAVRSSNVEYLTLTNYIESTQNNVGKADAQARLGRLRKAAFSICELAHEEALEAIRARESELAQRDLGDQTASAIEIAGREFGRYVESLRDTRRVLTDQSLAEEIAALAPNPVVGEIQPTTKAVAGKKISRREGGGFSIQD